ncbi:MAG: hypothetical protein JW745_05640 [Sedimentisphaerales bacterium]|nr:hypothetical protein [Sedimentisphaerales bacterium]MBN2842169.1 hypothetical protein [Sedimentisphaerales bacterium]
MDSRKITYLILLAMATGLLVVHLETIHIQSVNRMISMQAEEQELAKEIAQQQVELNSEIHSPEILLRRIKELNLEIKPLIDVEYQARDSEQEGSEAGPVESGTAIDPTHGAVTQFDEEATDDIPVVPVLGSWGDTHIESEQQYNEDPQEEYRPEDDPEDNTGATTEFTDYDYLEGEEQYDQEYDADSEEYDAARDSFEFEPEY